MLERLNKLLNLSTQEWPRVLVAWSMVFLTRMSFIIGGSILTAVFLSRIGIDLLPALFLVNAIFMMSGSVIFKKLIHKFRREVLITFSVLLGASALLISIFFLNRDTTLFLVFFLLAESVLLSQLNILVSLFNEELFSPLESQRTFPIIESAETIGGILGGLALSVLAESIPTYKFIIVCAILLLAILPIVLRYNARTMDIPKLKIKEEKEEERQEESHFQLKRIPFLKTLMIVIALHWAMINLIEFQYTKAIQQEVYSSHEETLVLEEDSKVALASEDWNAEELYQEEIAQKLGTLHLIFNSAALFIQLIFASRILLFLGITASMLLHPLVTLLNLVGMTLRFNFFTASITRGTYELTNILFKNAYDSSYYAIPHHFRSEAKEWIQGFIKPLGAMGGTLFMIVVALQLKGFQQTLVLNIALLLMSVIMGVFLWRLNKQYTQMSEQNLSHKFDLPTRLNAVEILAQNGHEKTSFALQKILKRDKEPEILKESILNTLGLKEDPEAIASILEMLSSTNDHLRWAAVDALGHYHRLKQELMEQSFTRYRVIESLKEQLKKEENEAILEKLIYIFYELAPELLTQLIIETIEKEEKQKASFIRMLRLFHDANIRFYLEKNLLSRDPSTKAAAIIALWQFKPMQNELKHHLSQMLKSKKVRTVCAAIEACGVIKEASFKEELLDSLKNNDPEIQKASLLALAQMEERSTIPHLVEAMSNPEHEWFAKTIRLLASFSKSFHQEVQEALHLKISEKISRILSKEKTKALHELNKDTLELLAALYTKINAHHEVHHIKKTLENRA